MCALWSSLGLDGEPLDGTVDVADIAPESLEDARRGIVDFVDLVGREVGETWREVWELGSLGHDFWLTRNGHGAGFWDRYGFSNQPGRDLGNTLSKLARSAGSSDAYVGDDGRVYLTRSPAGRVSFFAMKHIRFFQEFSDKRRTAPTGNVVAAFTGNGAFVSGGTAQYEAIVGLFAEANSPVCGSSVAIDYLRTRCKRVSEAVARRVHPALFLRLDRA